MVSFWGLRFTGSGLIPDGIAGRFHGSFLKRKISSIFRLSARFQQNSDRERKKNWILEDLEKYGIYKGVFQKAERDENEKDAS